MKIQVTFKDPDGLDGSLEDTLLGVPADLPEDERELLREKRLREFREFASDRLRYGEYVDLEFDTEAGTCVVVRNDS